MSWSAQDSPQQRIALPIANSTTVKERWVNHYLALGKNHSRIVQVVMYHLSVFFFLDAVTYKLFFRLLLWPSALDISHLSPRSTPHPSPLCPPPWRLTCLDCRKELPFDVSLDSSGSDNHRRLAVRREQVLGFQSLGFLPADSEQVDSLGGRKAVWQRSAPSCFPWLSEPAVPSQLLSTARPCTITVVSLHPAL